MLATNIETEIREILEKKGKGGWLRVAECAKEYGKDVTTGERNKSKETKFYRWRKKVEKGKVEGFQIVPLPGNIVYIGLKSANPNELLKSIVADPSTKKKFGFLERFKRKKKEKELFSPTDKAWLSHALQRDNRYMKNFAKTYIWLSRGAKPEEKPELET